MIEPDGGVEKLLSGHPALIADEPEQKSPCWLRSSWLEPVWQIAFFTAAGGFFAAAVFFRTT